MASSSSTAPSGELRRGLSRNLTDNLIPPPSNDVPPNTDQPQYGQLRRQGTATAEDNRQQFNENQHRVASDLLRGAMEHSLILLLCLFFIIVAYAVTGLVLFIMGWSLYSRTGGKPCDQPLREWLLATLLCVSTEKVIGLTLSIRIQAGDESCRPHHKRFTIVMWIIKVVLLWLGFMWRHKSRTCSETSPELYRFITIYLMYKLIAVVFSSLLVFLSLSLVMWMARNGIGPFAEPGKHMAGRPGLTSELETVAYSPELFANGEVSTEKEPPECSVCQEAFDTSRVIKRTPCGHYFHEECLGNWLGNYARTCPLCRLNLEDATKTQEP